MSAQYRRVAFHLLCKGHVQTLPLSISSCRHGLRLQSYLNTAVHMRAHDHMKYFCGIHKSDEATLWSTGSVVTLVHCSNTEWGEETMWSHVTVENSSVKVAHGSVAHTILWHPCCIQRYGKQRHYLELSNTCVPMANLVCDQLQQELCTQISAGIVYTKILSACAMNMLLTLQQK